jgi:hypothetical protein
MSKKHAAKKHPSKQTKYKNQDQHRWRKVAAWVMPFISVPIGFTVFAVNSYGVGLAAFTWIVFFVYCQVILEWYIWRSPRQRRLPRSIFFGLCLLCVLGGGIWYRNLPRPKVWLALSEDEKHRFIETLKAQTTAKDHVRIGCPLTDEDICVRATSFIDAFKRGGFFVENDKVERATLSHPVAGISLLTYGHADDFDPQDPDQGKWSKLTDSKATVDRAFAEVGITPLLASDENLPQNVIAIFFGIQPAGQSERKNLKQLKDEAEKQLLSEQSER